MESPENVPPPPPPLANSAFESEELALLSTASYAAQVAEESKLFLQQTDHKEYYSSTSIHAFSSAEKMAFAKHINSTLAGIPALSDKLPLDPKSDDIFTAVRDGTLLCFLINASVPGTVDESKMIQFFRDEKSRLYHYLTNHNLCIEGAKKIGAVIVNLGAEDLMEGKPYLVFGLIWQIIKIGLLKEVTVERHPELMQLAEEGGVDLQSLPAEELLLKWFNYHLRKNGYSDQVANFTTDVKNCDAYIHLMNRLAPETCSLAALQEADPLQKAELIIANAEKMGCRTILTPQDIIQGNERLNLVFTASMFNQHTGMIPIAEEMEKENSILTQENEKLKEELETVRQQLSTSTCTIQTITTEKETVSTELETVSSEKCSLQEKLDQAVENNTKLVEMVQQLDQEKQALERSKEELNQQLQTTVQQLRQATDQLQKEKLSLETSEFCSASLANDLEDLRSRQEKLEYLIAHLKIERMRSDMHVERLRILYDAFASTEALCVAIYKSLTLASIKAGATRCGYLTKKARSGTSWQVRYFILRDNFLFYYKNDKDMSAVASAVVRIDDAVVRFAENPTRTDLKEQWLLCIEIPHGPDSVKELYIAGVDHELEGWKAQIKTAAGWWTKKSSMASIKRQMVGGE